MRNEQTIKDLIVEKAKLDKRIRAVLLNGSRANPNIKPDNLQDFDVVYVVTDIETFISDHNWVNYFGKRLIWQLPNQMGLYDGAENVGEPFSYLMLFEDRNRIDLTLVATHHVDSNYRLDSLTVVWLDKDGAFLDLHESNESDYIIKRPVLI